MVVLSEVSPTEKDKYCISLICGIKKKNGANELIYKTKIKLLQMQKTILWLPREKGINWKTYKGGLTYAHLCAECSVAKSCLTLFDSMDCSLPGSSLCPWGFPGKNAQSSCHFLPQGIFLIQGSKSHLLHQQADSFTTEPPGKAVHTLLVRPYCIAQGTLLRTLSWPIWKRI